jgi:hypothetical protein
LDGGGPTGSNVTFGFIQSVGATTTVVSCSSPASAGSGVIPSSALSYLTATNEPSSEPAFGIGSSSVASVTVQDWEIRIVAEPPDFVEFVVAVE